MKNTNPKPKSFTPQQEEELSYAEALHVRAEILTAGVAKSLTDGAHCGTVFLDECVDVMQEACDLHEEAYALQENVRKTQGENGPPVTMRRARRTRKSKEPKQSARLKRKGSL